MFTAELERKVEWLLGIAIFLVTVTVTPNLNVDPINAPKLLVLCGVSFAIGAILLSQVKKLFKKPNLKVVLIARSLSVLMLLAMFLSKAPFTQQFFGANGRNTGLLAYFAFGTLFIGASIIPTVNVKKPLLIGISSALGLNAIYGLAQALGKDPINWVNPYSPVIGTLGNPDFVSALLGIGVAFAFAYLISASTDIKYRALSAIYLVASAFDIVKSHAQQGAIIAALSIFIATFFYLRSKKISSGIQIGYLLFGGIAGLLATLGSFKIGPLASVLYKASVTYRGDYWHAAIVMIKNHPFFGVGLDSYGDWYRASRTLEATVRRGPSTVSNAAHNVFLDIAATAGILAFLAYLAVILLSVMAAIRIIKRGKDFDPFFVSIFVAWIGYLIQSTISINNLALGIWGWILPGIILSIDRWQRNVLKTNSKKNNDLKARDSKSIDFSGMTLTAGLIVGLAIGYFPFNADANFRHALELGDANKIYAAATKWPQDSARMIYAAQIFNHNDLPEQALKLTKEVVKANPRNFDAWVYIYNAKSTSAKDKSKILLKLRAIDPHNTDIK